MNPILTSIILLAALVVMVLLGRGIRRRLPGNHLADDSKDAVKLAMGLVATMTALLLGLLVSSAKNTYDTQRTEVIQMVAKVTMLNRVLAAYGPDAAEARAEFRIVVEDAARRMWPDEADRRGGVAPSAPAGESVYAVIHGLSPKDEMQRGLKAQAAALVVELGELRILLLAQMVPSIPRLLLAAVVCWLAILFLSFSLLAPPNATTTFSMIAAAVSVAGAVFLILELDQPLGGMMRISPEPMLHALGQLGH